MKCKNRTGTVQIESSAVSFNFYEYAFMLKLHFQQKEQFVPCGAEALVMKANYMYGFHVSTTLDLSSTYITLLFRIAFCPGGFFHSRSAMITFSIYVYKEFSFCDNIS